MKKNRFSYGFYVLILVLLSSMFIGCSDSIEADLEVQSQENKSQSSQLQNGSSESLDKEGNAEADLVQGNDSNLKQDEADSESHVDAEENSKIRDESQRVEFEVKQGMYLTEILTNLVKAGWGESVENVLEHLEQMNREKYLIWSQIQNTGERAFLAEGYIAPGQYVWTEDSSLEEVLDILLGSWDELLTEDILEQAKQQGYSMDEILIMASIVEWESSFDPSHVVKPNVAAVVRNRIESETPLQMDVTIFYLQESLQPYRDPGQYEGYYDTYIRDGLPAGPIGSPSMDSIRAVLDPADTEDLFFVYDEAGNYYFAEDYEQHLINCELAGIY